MPDPKVLDGDKSTCHTGNSFSAKFYGQWQVNQIVVYGDEADGGDSVGGAEMYAVYDVRLNPVLVSAGSELANYKLTT